MTAEVYADSGRVVAICPETLYIHQCIAKSGRQTLKTLNFSLMFIGPELLDKGDEQVERQGR